MELGLVDNNEPLPYEGNWEKNKHLSQQINRKYKLRHKGNDRCPCQWCKKEKLTAMKKIEGERERYDAMDIADFLLYEPESEDVGNRTNDFSHRPKKLDELEVFSKWIATNFPDTPSLPIGEDLQYFHLSKKQTSRLSAQLNVKTLYHMTSQDAAQNILASRIMIPSSRGMVGQGIYMTTSPEHCYGKARVHGVMLELRVNLGNVKVISRNHGNVNWHNMQRDDFDTVLVNIDRPEYVIASASQILSIRAWGCNRNASVKDGTVVLSRWGRKARCADCGTICENNTYFQFENLACTECE
jgi:hypothetical protein